ncbi:PaaI family thioesterase [Actinotalea sp. K2]|uniref:PaaI family thioesterase n=1 Tax=Actinotalea sp. K2 TaxID=2939438 RepID=UPI002017985D|nr:hotdog fold thioesterase [Actinotalea sp. K2]MCL3860682.1 hotdog fold thioesterase [Actinotalea sp. K2]
MNGTARTEAPSIALARPVEPIWNGVPSLAVANELSGRSLIGRLGIELLEVGEDYLSARMPVDDRTRQPMGVLHGGASVTLAETLASWASTFTVDRDRASSVGMEINANHLRPVTSGWVTGVARPIALGRRTQVWEIRITDDDGRLVCISRCTMAVISRSSP